MRRTVSCADQVSDALICAALEFQKHYALAGHGTGTYQLDNSPVLDTGRNYHLTGTAIDDPDVTITENFACKSDNNFTKYCNPEVDKRLAAQSAELDPEKRRTMVWDIERLLAEEIARPIYSHGRAAQCWQPHLRGYVRQENSIYNHWRLEQVWLDK